jgi:hypothetical protein
MTREQIIELAERLTGPSGRIAAQLEFDGETIARLTAERDAALAQLAARQAPAPAPARWRHVKRGSTYVELARGELQSSARISEGTRLVSYQGDDGTVYFRPVSEFEDGRFVRIDGREELR